MEQESPPAWTQEAYRPPCSEYSFCCPTWVPPGGGGPGTPPGGVPSQVPPRGVRVPPGGGGGPGTPGGVRGGGSRYPPGVPSQVPWGGYPVRYPPGGSGYPPSGGGGGGVWVPPHCLMAFWEMLQSIMGYGYPPPGVDRQTKWNYYLPVVLRTRAVIIQTHKYVKYQWFDILMFVGFSFDLS